MQVHKVKSSNNMNDISKLINTFLVADHEKRSVHVIRQASALSEKGALVSLQKRNKM